VAKRPLLSLLQQTYPDEKKEELFARVLCGEVMVDGERVKDPKRPVAPTAEIMLAGRGFVSRGGEKLDAALAAWQIPVEGKVFLDAGASTGGFTDCLLQRGASRVHAVDVGFNQLAYSLRRDDRVIVHESTNITEVGHLDPPADAAVCDLSFRSLVGVSGSLLALTVERWFIALVKPQFEWKEPSASFDGVVRRREDALSILTDTLERLAAEGAHARRLIASPIRGRRGNYEFLALCSETAGPSPDALVETLDQHAP
jgi:23S rRNA (cytidine1920-2'-O)/16S rRNA (cytidine1409-2'-O)-methyltransferase